MTVEGGLHFARRFAWLGLVGSGVLWVCFVAEIFLMVRANDFIVDRQIITADHLAFYTGARLTRFGPEDKLYDYHYVGNYQNKLFYKDPDDPKRDVWTMLEAFRNPPFYAMLYWPTCGWPYFYSAITWFAISIGLTILGTWWLSDRRFVWGLLWVLSFFPTFAALDYGQNTPLSFAIFAAVYVLLKKRMPFAAGLAAGLLLFKPQLLLGLGVWALLDIRRKWPCVLGVLVTGGVLVAISITVLPTATEGFRKSFVSNTEFDSFEQHKMHNPLAFARLLLPREKIAEALAADDPEQKKWIETWVRRVHNGFAIACSLAALVAFIWLWRHRGGDLHVMFGGVVFFTLFAGPHALIYEWMLLAITGLLWAREWRDRPNTWFALYAAVWGVLYFSTHLNGEILSVIPVTIQWSVPVFGVVGWYAVHLLTKPGTEPVSP